MRLIAFIALGLSLPGYISAANLPDAISGPIKGHLSSTARFTANVTSHPTITEYGVIADGTLTFGTLKLSDFEITETERYSEFTAKTETLKVSVFVPNPYLGIYSISFYHASGAYENYIIRRDRPKP